MEERWPFPVSQTMQRQTGSRIKVARPAPPIQPVSLDTALNPSPALQPAPQASDAAPFQADSAPKTDW